MSLYPDEQGKTESSPYHSGCFQQFCGQAGDGNFKSTLFTESKSFTEGGLSNQQGCQQKKNTNMHFLPN